VHGIVTLLVEKLTEAINNFVHVPVNSGITRFRLSRRDRFTSI